VRNRTKSQAARGILLSTFILAAEGSLLIPLRDSVGQVTATSVFLLSVTVIGFFADWISAAWFFVMSGFVLNWFFMQPHGTLKISQAEDIAGFVTYFAASISSVVLVHAWRNSRRITEQAVLQASEASDRAARGEERLEWLSHISHDVRTPLSTVRAVVEEMKSGIEYEQATRDELLEVAVDEVDRLDRLVSNWLLLGKLDAQPVSTELVAIDIGEVVSDSIRRLAPLLRNHDVVVKITPDLDQIDGSFQELQHLVINLLTNSQAHSGDGTRIYVDVMNSGDKVVLLIEDNGTGFPEFDANVLLQPFVAGNLSSSTGLGLSICAQVVLRHNGTIELSNRQGSGASVRIEFPRRESTRRTA
jgi:K+-sensing histidine kinase KdpD